MVIRRTSHTVEAQLLVQPPEPAKPQVYRRARSAIVGTQPIPEALAPAPRLRVVHKNNAIAKAADERIARDKIDDVLKLIANEEIELDATMARLENHHAEVEQLLRSANLSSHSDGRYKSEIKEVFSRQSRTIDPKKFKNAVADKDFWTSISVSVTEAGKVLSTKELDNISEVVPAKSTGFAFTLKKVERTITTKKK